MSESEQKFSLDVAEIFYSLQGEGRYTGQVSVFVRLAGCNLRCFWCDTPYALEKRQGRSMSVEQIVDRVGSYDCRHVVVTGGEPLIWPGLSLLLHELHTAGKFVTVETNGTQYRPIEADLVSISPKLANSVPKNGPHADFARRHERARLNVEAIGAFMERHDYQLKFVVDAEEDLVEMEAILDRLTNLSREKVMLMPQARTKAQYRRAAPRVAQWCIERGLAFCPRLQVELWGARRGR